jgi:hypothetical protein
VSRFSLLHRHFFHRSLGAALFALAICIPAYAAKDLVQFGSTIDVPANDKVHDTVCFFCSVNVKGTVEGDIVVFFGSVRIDGHANHDVVNFFGDVTASNDSSIGHDMVNFFGGVHLGKNVTVGQDAVVMFGSMHSDESASVGGSRVVEPGWIFWGPLLFLVIGVYVVVHEVRGYNRRRMLGSF